MITIHEILLTCKWLCGN